MALALCALATQAFADLPALSVTHHGARGDGVADDSAAFQAAIDAAYLGGGGVVSVPGSPEGYRLARPVLVRPNVTLRGIHAGPTDAHFLAQHDAGAKQLDRRLPGGIIVAQDAQPAVTLAHNAGVAGLTFIYHDQVPFDTAPIRPYPPLLQVRTFAEGEDVPGVHRHASIPHDGPISGRSVTIRNIGALNAYHILDIAGDNEPVRQVAQITVDGLWGYPLSVGVSIQNSLDTVSLRNLQLRPTFFHAACGEISKTAIGLALGKSDGCVVSDLLIFGLGVGMLHRCIEGSLQAFSVRVCNANIEAMIPVWMDSHAVDDQVQYANSFLFHTHFGFEPAQADVYSREGHRLFSDLRFTPKDLCVARICNSRPESTFQSYARFVGCGFHARSKGPVCRVEGNQLVRVILASSNMVYFAHAVLDVAEGARVLATITGNDIMCWGAPGLSTGTVEDDLGHLVDLTRAGPSCNVIFSDNMLHGADPRLVDDLAGMPGVVAEGNCLAR